MTISFVVIAGALVVAPAQGVLGFVGLPSRRKLLNLRASSPELSDDEGDELIQRMTKNFFGSNPPLNPFERVNRPNKLDVYDVSELQTLWNIHERNKQVFKAEQDVQSIDGTNVLSMHGLILQSLGETLAENTEPASILLDWMDDNTKQKIANVRAIASDVDGTLLTSKMTLHPRTKQAIQRSLAAARSPLQPIQWFFPATGKSRKGALDSLGPEIGALLATAPGVFLQGLYCVDEKGQIVFEQRLPATAVDEVERLVAELEFSMVAYDGDDLYTTQVTASVRELHELYGEPMPVLLSGAISDHAPGVHKILLMDPDPKKLNMIRPKLEALAAANNACVTQAIPTMLELLPHGCSKALGVRKLCEKLGIDMETQLLAIGDAENDVLMLQQASIGVAMGNASPIAKEAADFVMDETNNDGGAGAAIEVFGFGQLL